MANGVRINNLNKATSLNDTDTITIIQDNENKKISVSLLDKDGTYTQSVVNTIPDLITTSKANVETTKQAIDEKFGYDEFSAQIVTSQAMSSVGVSDDGSVDVSSQVQDGFMESATLYGKTQYHDTTADVYYDSMPEDMTGMTLELVSVKMPILTTTGKNLCKYRSNWEANGLTFTNTNDGVIVNGIASGYDVDYYLALDTRNGEKINVETLGAINKLPVGTNLYLSNNLGKDNYFSYIMNNGNVQYNKSVTIKDGMKIIGLFVRFQKGDVCENLKMTVQLEEGSTATSYEPYKSSILSCNEEVILRGIGDVKDTLDCLTGELTQRIGEVVLDGSENWKEYVASGTSLKRFVCEDKILNAKSYNEISNILPNNGESWTKDITNLSIDEVKKIVIQFNSSDSRYNYSLDEFKQWLSQNAITVQYKLETESIKTVDLNSSNGDVKTPVVYKNGHILLESVGLIPELHYSIPVSYSGLIAQNTMTNLKHSWRLDELEIMAYTSIVNSQYESLILVAAAETNEVVVSSEYVPDESLYNMLKVLVNANALENADEKINVFYLYGKLSDEMYIDLIMGDDM